MELKRRALALEIKEVQADGRFSGYVSTWGTVDSYRERMERGAFAESLAATTAAGRALPILWQHKTDDPIGHWPILREDDHGLYGEGELWLDVTPNAARALRGMRTKSVNGLSIGFYTQDDSFDETTRIRTLKKVDLRECSIVTDPANSDARIDSVRAKLAAGERISKIEFETVLQEGGFSHSEATEIAVHGFTGSGRREADEPKAAPRTMGDLARVLGSLSLPK